MIEIKEEDYRKKRHELFEKLPSEEWPDDGTDWDGISNDTLQQILQDHEDAKRWNKFRDSTVRTIVEENINTTDRRIVKRLEERIKELDNHDEIVNTHYCIKCEGKILLQKILEAKK